MQKGYKREGRGMAVLRCFIGVFIVIVVVLLAYFMLRLDYSDKLDPEASMRPYVEMTPSPVPTVAPTKEAAEPTATMNIVPVATTAPTAAPTAKPTAEPTAEPTATPEPKPTPEPTKIPESAISPLKADGLTLPALSTMNAKLGITHSYRSSADGFKLLQVQGYAYVDDPSYDGATADVYLVIMQSTGKFIAAKPTKIEGISGVDHTGALCANPSASDFEAVIDVTKFPDEIYNLGVVFMYQNGEEKHIEYFNFPSDTTFTVLSKQVISDIKITDAE